MKNQKKVYYTVTGTFKNTTANVLNLLSRKDWLQPKIGIVHPMFGHLLASLGGAEKENIEQVIRWKYRHPADFLLPALV